MSLTCTTCGRRVADSESTCPDDGTPLDPMSGVILSDRYRIGARLGEGGIGAVYEAEHIALGRAVAIKILRRELAGMTDLQARFDREARALSRLSHTNVVSVTDFGVWQGLPYLVMEVIRGRSLAEELHAGLLGTDRAVGIIRQVLAALVYAHGERVIHRDLKPSNVMLVAQPGIVDLVKILDFGLAKFLSRAEVNDISITKDGAVFGTPAYMSPEQVSGEATDERSDIYAVGLLLFECLTGRRPFTAETRADVMRAHLAAEPPRAGDVSKAEPIPTALEDVAHRALAKRPKDRFASAEEMLRALDEAVGAPATSLARGDISRSGIVRTSVAPPATMRAASSRTLWRLVNRPFRLGLAGMGVAALVAVGLIVWSSQDPSPRRPAATAQPAPPAPEPTTASAGPPARDPWAADVPGELAQLREDLRRGSPAALKAAKAYAREHEDPRVHLLIGHHYFERRWLGDALDRYRIALRLDPTARGEPQLLPRLAAMLGPDANGRRAAGLITEHWGLESAPGLAKVAVEHPRAEVARGAIALLDEMGESARVDHTGVALADLSREKTCPARRAALARLRGRRDPRIAPALSALADQAGPAARCLGPALQGAIREAR